MIDINWLKVIFFTIVMQICISPLFHWESRFPQLAVLKRIRIIFRILLGPIIVFMFALAQATSDEVMIISLLSGAGVGIQGIILSLLYRGRKKTGLSKGLRSIARILTYVLVVLILMVLGLFFLIHQYYTTAIVFMIIVICVSIIGIIKMEKLGPKRRGVLK